jgi:hypothetical protein
MSEKQIKTIRKYCKKNGFNLKRAIKVYEGMKGQEKEKLMNAMRESLIINNKDNEKINQ